MLNLIQQYTDSSPVSVFGKIHNDGSEDPGAFGVIEFDKGFQVFFDNLWKENQRFGEFVGKQVNELRLELGAPTEDFVNELGNETLVYKTKKYGIPCERKFEINATGTIVGFTSSGCI